MSNKNARNRSPYLVVGVIALLSGLAVLSWMDVAEIEAEPESIESTAAVPNREGEPSPSGASETPIPSFEFPPLSEYSAIVERPLFSPTRRPIHVITELPVESLPPLDTYVLIGVIDNANGMRALLRNNSSGETEVVAPGQDVHGWSVESVLPDQVTLKAAGQERIVYYAE